MVGSRLVTTVMLLVTLGADWKFSSRMSVGTPMMRPPVVVVLLCCEAAEALACSMAQPWST